MARTSTAKATSTRATTTKAASKARPTPAHPSFVDMIVECIIAHRDDSRTGVSRPMIKKFLEEKYKIDITPSHITNINRAITRGVETKVFALPKGPSGKVRLAPKKPAPEGKENHPPAKKTATTTTKKPAASGATKKATSSKAPAIKKTASTTAKSKAKPATTKSSSTKAKAPATKKSTRTKAPAKSATTKATPAKAATKKPATAKKPATTKKAPAAKSAAKPKKTTSSTSTTAKAKASGATSTRSGRSTRGTTTSSRGTKRYIYPVERLGSRITIRYTLHNVLGMSSKSRLNVVMGAMTFGKPGTEGTRIETIEAVGEILDVFKSYGHCEVDTARVYTNGSSEELLGEAEWQKRGLVVQTKLYPSGLIRHTPEGIREHLYKSLNALRAEKVELFYLHAPDRSTPFEVTFRAVDELHKEGRFAKLGISNYMAWEVAEIVTLCRVNGWIQPTVYQGIYNAVHRAVEPELLPCLRKSKEHQLTIAECALRWINYHSLLKPEYGDAIIIGASRKDHVDSNLRDLEKGPLPTAVVEALDKAWEILRPSVGKYWH
ncbi:unnamed protein product [Rhizoctonia solani]|uniref:Histone H1 n=1 Tax=Rhizoctonia solani TaxID=456999 RepID=A0A8H3GN91_9AGAM|nr:unnamed protein product [Rhizoctonia solani]